MALKVGEIAPQILPLCTRLGATGFMPGGGEGRPGGVGGEGGRGSYNCISRIYLPLY